MSMTHGLSWSRCSVNEDQSRSLSQAASSRWCHYIQCVCGYEGVVGYGIVYGCGVDRLRESLEEVRVDGVPCLYGLYVPMLVLRVDVIVSVAKDGVCP